MSLFNVFFKKFSLHPIQGVALSILLFMGIQAFAQPFPNPYRMVDTWAKLPDGRTMGAVGDAHIGWVHYFIRVPHGDPRNKQGTGAEFVAVDKEGNLYGGEPTSRTLQKYVRVWRYKDIRLTGTQTTSPCLFIN